MTLQRKLLTIFICITVSCSYANTLDEQLTAILGKHFTTYQDQEYFSGVTLSVSLPNAPIKNYYMGRVSHEKNSAKISADTLFQIGSITKSFTAVLMLQLEKEKKLSLKDTLGQWLPSYSRWSAMSLTSLLNMSSGVPNYSDTPLLNAAEYHDLAHAWTDAELIQFVYPQTDLTPPLRKGYFYSNTGYILAAMIIEKITHHPFSEEVTDRAIKAAGLKNTFYLDDSVSGRMAHGYNFNQYDNPALVGQDVSSNNMTWAGAAGAIVSTSDDVVKWVKALYTSQTLLDAAQRAALTSVISQTTGKPINDVTKDDPRGFGLGVVRGYDPMLGKYWFYEGETVGFRALYFYQPCSGIIISAIFNSAINSENDHAGELMKHVYQAILKSNPSLQCGKKT